MGLGGKAGVVMDGTIGVGILHQRAEHLVVEHKFLVLADNDFNAQRQRTGLGNFDVLRVTVFRDEKNIAAGLNPRAQGHGLGGGGRFIQHGGVGNVQCGQFAGEGLKVEQRFHATLRNFGLIGRVLRVPAGVFEDVALDHRRRDGVVIALADEGTENLVMIRDPANLGQRGHFAAGGRDMQAPLKPDLAGHGGGDQVIELFKTQLGEHGSRLSGIGADVAAGKLVRMGQNILCQRHKRKHKVGPRKKRDGIM